MGYVVTFTPYDSGACGAGEADGAAGVSDGAQECPSDAVCNASIGGIFRYSLWQRGATSTLKGVADREVCGGPPGVTPLAVWDCTLLGPRRATP